MTRWIGLCAVATLLLSSIEANAATPPARDSQAQQAKSVGAGSRTRALAAQPAPKAKSPKPAKVETHRVFNGQTLGMIAKRYNVTIDALCTANGITRKDKIQPGQKLIVPARSDKDGSLTRQLVLSEPEPATPALQDPAPSKPKAPENVAAKTNDSPKAIAANRNVIGDRFPKVAPARAALPTPGTKAKGKSQTWAQYKKSAQKKGYVVLNATGRNWKGYAIVKGNRLASSAQGGFNHALYSWRTGSESQISPALIRMLALVSDTFGGRPLRVVSGYREHSHAKESRHKLGHACDFSIVGVPNEALRDYLLQFDGVGVGYYPNSSFVHLDVRRLKTVWVDYSAPGERPRYAHDKKNRRAAGKAAVGDFSEASPSPVLPSADTTAPKVLVPSAPANAPIEQPAHPPLLAAGYTDDSTVEGLPRPSPEPSMPAKSTVSAPPNAATATQPAAGGAASSAAAKTAARADGATARSAAASTPPAPARTPAPGAAQ